MIQRSCPPSLLSGSPLSTLQLRGTIGTVGPLPNESPASVVNPAGSPAATLAAVPAKPKTPAP